MLDDLKLVLSSKYEQLLNNVFADVRFSCLNISLPATDLDAHVVCGMVDMGGTKFASSFNLPHRINNTLLLL
jgi:hypothetical protein